MACRCASRPRKRAPTIPRGELFNGHMRIPLCRLQRGMPQHLLHFTQIRSPIQQKGSSQQSKRAGRHPAHRPPRRVIPRAVPCADPVSVRACRGTAPAWRHQRHHPYAACPNTIPARLAAHASTMPIHGTRRQAERHHPLLIACQSPDGWLRNRHRLSKSHQLGDANARGIKQLENRRTQRLRVVGTLRRGLVLPSTSRLA